MAYAPARSCREALAEGMTDGAVWKATPDRGGVQSSPSNQYQAAPVSVEQPMRGLLGHRGEC